MTKFSLIHLSFVILFLLASVRLIELLSKPPFDLCCAIQAFATVPSAVAVGLRFVARAQLTTMVPWGRRKTERSCLLYLQKIKIYAMAMKISSA